MNNNNYFEGEVDKWLSLIIEWLKWFLFCVFDVSLQLPEPSTVIPREKPVGASTQYQAW